MPSMKSASIQYEAMILAGAALPTLGTGQMADGCILGKEGGFVPASRQTESATPGKAVAGRMRKAFVGAYVRPRLVEQVHFSFGITQQVGRQTRASALTPGGGFHHD